MNDEIKEILVILNKMAKENKESDNPLQTTVIFFEVLYKLLDYITNLQQIEQEHQKINGDLRERIAYLERSNDRREDTILGLRQEVYEQEDYKSRCEKAIEYLQYATPLRYQDLLNILQNGSDDNE